MNTRAGYSQIQPTVPVSDKYLLLSLTGKKCLFVGFQVVQLQKLGCLVDVLMSYWEWDTLYCKKYIDACECECSEL